MSSEKQNLSYTADRNKNGVFTVGKMYASIIIMIYSGLSHRTTVFSGAGIMTSF